MNRRTGAVTAVAFVACVLGSSVLVAAPEPAEGEKPSLRAQFRDAEDGALDASDWLLSRHGFLPVPIIITEPAVGYGGGIAIAHFSRSLADSPLSPNGRPQPPSISVGAAAATENGTWVGAIGHLGVWKNDRWRYSGGLGKADVTIKFYLDDEAGAQGLEYSAAAIFLRQQIERRVGSTDLFVGLRYTWSDLGIRFAEGNSVPGIGADEYDSRNGGLGALVTWDGRDNILSPEHGLYAKIAGSRYSENLGGDFDYDDLEVNAQGFFRFGERLGLAAQLVGQFIDGDAPFYGLPFIYLRGVPMGRYQGHDVATLEAELRLDFTKRWRLVTFGGVGTAAVARERLDEAKRVITWGGGFRYLMARKLGLRMGVDIARGPEKTAFYLVVGSAWR
jgi:hypothetical protein